MGEISRDIAKITEPKLLTVSGAPNFVIFENKREGEAKEVIEFQINLNYLANEVTDDFIAENMYIRFYDYLGQEHTFRASRYPDRVGGSTFLLTDDQGDNAENIRQAFLTDSWLSANYDVYIPYSYSGGTVINGRSLYLTAKGAPDEFNVTVETVATVYPLIWLNDTPDNKDSISGQSSDITISLDIYENTGIFLGEDPRISVADNMGLYLLTITKTYAGFPLWFELNGIFRKTFRYSAPNVAGWFNTGTLLDYRFIAKVRGKNNFAFYQSDVLYVLAGSSKKLDPVDLSPYIYKDGQTVRLLTNKPVTTHVEGQKQYLNFVFSDPLHNQPDQDNYTVNVAYELYSYSDQFIQTVYKHDITRVNLSIVNTCLLDLDAAIATTARPVSRVRVCLMRNSEAISDYLEYKVLPDCLHKTASFSFLNALGGWESFNFDADVQSEIKEDSVTYNRTLTPYLTRNDSLELVHTKEVGKTFTVEGAPVSAHVARWIEELAASKVLLTNNGEYCIMEDFKTPVKNGYDLLTPIMKYRITDNPYNE